MAAVTIEAKIENGQLLLPSDFRLPDRGTAYVVIPDELEAQSVRYEDIATFSPLPFVVHLRSPRLADPEDAALFRKVMVEE